MSKSKELYAMMHLDATDPNILATLQEQEFFNFQTSQINE
jgi:hypothetical protein